MRKRFSIFLAAVLCCAWFCCPLACLTAKAAVSSTSEAAGGADSIYVAGNPNWYPLEYYDPDTKSYQGILPEILAQVGERTGLNFTYILAGKEDQRLRLAKNGQVEVVSGYALDAAELQDYSMTGSKVILTIPQDGQDVQVCFAFTDIADDSLIAAVEEALDGISSQETAGLCIRYVMEHPERQYPRWVLPAGVGILVVLTVIIVILIRQRLKYKKLVERDKRYDLMTGIGNKAYFAEQFEKFIPDEYRGIYCVVLVEFDIVRVNQYYGETEAEEQLRFAANEIMKSTADNEIAARISGGGFAIARPSSNEQEAGAWTEALLSRINKFNERYGKDYHPDFHAGIYMLEPEDRDCETVLFNARQGYRLAVARNTDYAFSYTEQLLHESEELQLKKQTPEAIQNREFKMFLQFIVYAESGKIKGAEALSRWEHPKKGLLYPSSYIELMESEGTIGELDFYIFEEVCKQLEAWQKNGHQASISCNFTRITIGSKDFFSRLQKIVSQYFFDHAALVIEITEDSLEDQKKIAFENISKCKALGFQIALDDMGSGYTSFSDLRDYPIDIVKIDRSVLNSAVNLRGAELLRGMITLVKSLHMKVLCEGVENAQQVELLRQLGCDYIQGYYFYRALPVEEAELLLDEVKQSGT